MLSASTFDLAKDAYAATNCKDEFTHMITSLSNGDSIGSKAQEWFTSRISRFHQPTRTLV